jgi:FRG domain
MAKIFKAADVNEALEMAERWKNDGKYDLFRGQTDCKWLVQSSLTRYSDYQEAHDKSGRFEAWVKSTPGLESLAQDVDQVIAIGQHYGLPTHFVDFTYTPKVAAFFAIDGVDSDAEYEGCIICLNTPNFFEFWENYSKSVEVELLPELIRVSVPNLWRIEAQKGVFLFNPYDHIERIYDFDRIVFPQNKTPIYFKRQELYPDQESQLELLLRQFFMHENMLKNHSTFLEGLKGTYVCNVDGELPNASALVREIDILPSWEGVNLKQWIEVRSEKYDGYTQPINIQLPDENLPTQSFVSEITQKIIKQMERQRRLRQSMIDWKLIPDNSLSPDLAPCLRTLWNGIRLLPFSDELVAESLANMILMSRWLSSFGISKRDFESHFGNAHEIEMASSDGSYSRSLVSDAAVVSSIRKDILSFIKLEKEEEISPTILYQIINDPKRVFEYDKLCDWFVAQVVPYQVLTRQKSAVFFSPARLSVIGRP